MAREPTKITELLQKIESQAERAGAIIQRIRNLLHETTPELLPVPLHAVFGGVRDAMETQLDNHACRLDCSFASDFPVVMGNALQLQLVLINLLQNAINSMQSLADNADKVVTIECHQISDREIQVSVADRGPGVRADLVAEIFEPLFSINSNGLGMGLAICRKIIEAHGGRIWYTPNPSGGAIFQFTLQLAR